MGFCEAWHPLPYVGEGEAEANPMKIYTMYVGPITISYFPCMQAFTVKFKGCNGSLAYLFAWGRIHIACVRVTPHTPPFAALRNARKDISCVCGCVGRRHIRNTGRDLDRVCLIGILDVTEGFGKDL